jgi:hypothetical protein
MNRKYSGHVVVDGAGRCLEDDDDADGDGHVVAALGHVWNSEVVSLLQMMRIGMRGAADDGVR